MFNWFQGQYFCMRMFDLLCIAVFAIVADKTAFGLLYCPQVIVTYWKYFLKKT